MLSNLVKNGETISVLLTLKYNGFELKYNQSPTTPPPPGGVWVKGLYPYHRKSVVLKPYAGAYIDGSQCEAGCHKLSFQFGEPWISAILLLIEENSYLVLLGESRVDNY